MQEGREGIRNANVSLRICDGRACRSHWPPNINKVNLLIDLENYDAFHGGLSKSTRVILKIVLMIPHERGSMTTLLMAEDVSGPWERQTHSPGGILGIGNLI